MFDEILWLSMNTNGGISYEMAYHMPVAYRLINIKKVADKIKEHNEKIEQANNKGTSMSMEDLTKRKDFKPDYVASKAAPKK
jgi:hypothetical protein